MLTCATFCVYVLLFFSSLLRVSMLLECAKLKIVFRVGKNCKLVFDYSVRGFERNSVSFPSSPLSLLPPGCFSRPDSP